MDKSKIGLIKYRDRARQIKDFSGMDLPNGMSPTDIDGFVEYQNTLFILYELKLEGAKMSYGQQLAYERMCNALSKDRPTILFIGTHNLPPETDIKVEKCLVEKYYFNGKWNCPSLAITIKDAQDEFIKKYAPH